MQVQEILENTQKHKSQNRNGLPTNFIQRTLIQGHWTNETSKTTGNPDPNIYLGFRRTVLIEEEKEQERQREFVNAPTFS